MGPSRCLQRMVSRLVGGRSAPALALLFLAACGGDRGTATPADTAAVGTAASDTVPPVSPTDSVTAVGPDTGRTTSGATDSTSAQRQPGTAGTRSSQGPAGVDTGSAAKPAAKPAPKPAPKPAAPKPTASKPAAPKPAADTAASAAAPAPAPAQTAQDTSKPAADTTQAAAAPAQGAPLRDAYHQAPRDTVTQAVYDGWKQYNLNCARCHGEDVLGTTIAPHLLLSLKPDGPINSKELFVQVVCAGRPAKGMPAWCALGLGMDKIDQIYAYVHGRSEGDIGPGRPAVKQGG